MQSPCLRVEFHLYDLRQPLTAGRNRPDRRADRAASDHAPQADAAGVSGAAVPAAAARRQPAAAAAAASAVVAVAGGGHRAAGLCAGPAERAVRQGLGSQEAPVAAALVFDAAPHMEYRHENQTRLEAARDLGLWLLAQLPQESEIAVLDTRLGRRRRFRPDRGAAKDRIEQSGNRGQFAAAAGRDRRRCELLATEPLWHRKEIYVFTDLSRGAWPAGQAAALQTAACRGPRRRRST